MYEFKLSNHQAPTLSESFSLHELYFNYIFPRPHTTLQLAVLPKDIKLNPRDTKSIPRSSIHPSHTA